MLQNVNDDNFLRWDGAARDLPYTISGYGLSVFNLFANVESVVITPFDSCAASNGIDLASLNIKFIKNAIGVDVPLSRECQYDGAGNLTVFRPIDLSVTAYFIGLDFTDVLGNSAPETAVYFPYNLFMPRAAIFLQVTVSPVFTAWEAYPASAYCVLDNFGDNNGFQAWTQLRLYNTGSGMPISPLTLKPNNPADPDYITPVTDLISCPLAYGTGQYAPLFIANDSQNNADTSPNNNITITQVTLACSACGAGGTPVLLNLMVTGDTIVPGQTRRFNVPANAWDIGLTITYTVHAGGNMATCVPTRYWQSNIGGVVTGFPAPATVVDNTGTFGNNAITIPYPGGLTIFCQ